MQYNSKEEDKNSQNTGVFCSRVAKGWLVCGTQDRAYLAIVSLEPGHHILTFNTGMGLALYICQLSTWYNTCSETCHAVPSQISARH